MAVIGQRAQSEKDQIEKQIAADATAYEIKVRAAAELEAAELRAQATERLAKAKLADAEAVAKGEQRLIEARNATKNEIIVQDALIKLADKMPAIVAELMKPAEKISEMRVLNITGMGGGSDGNGAAGSSPIGGILRSFLEAGAALPMFKEMLRMANVDVDKTTVGEALRRAVRAVPGVAKVAELLPSELRGDGSASPPADVDVPAVEERHKGRGRKA